MSTQKEIAAHLDLSERRVRVLIKEGVLPSSKGRGGLDVDQCRVSYIGYLRGVSNGQVVIDGSDQGENENLKDLIDAETHRKLKRENDEADQIVAPVELLTEALEKSANIIMPVLESLPLEVKRNFPEVTGGQIRLVKKAVAVCRNAIADMELILDN